MHKYSSRFEEFSANIFFLSLFLSWHNRLLCNYCSHILLNRNKECCMLLRNCEGVLQGELRIVTIILLRTSTLQGKTLSLQRESSVKKKDNGKRERICDTKGLKSLVYAS